MSSSLSRAVLVVEDEIIVAMLLEDMLTELGHSVVGPAVRLERALHLAKTAVIDFAVLDINLDGEHSFAVADVLRERCIPFIFASGYGTAGLGAAYRDVFMLSKPFDIGQLERALARLEPSAAA